MLLGKRKLLPYLVATKDKSINFIYMYVMSQSNPWGLAQKNCPESGFDFWKLPGGQKFDKGRDFVEIQSGKFCPYIGLISDKYRVSQELLKMVNTTLLIFWDTLCEDWFWGFPSSDEWGPFSRRWEIPFSFVFLDFTSTCGNSLLVIQKAKLLHMNS